MQLETTHKALVIGLGGIGEAIALELLQGGHYSSVVGVSRRALAHLSPLKQAENYQHIQLTRYDESAIADTCRCLEHGRFVQIVCTLGLLHDEKTGLFPEKKLADVSEAQFAQYFYENVILPAIWLKHLPCLLPLKQASTLTFLSARVGSIGDNQLGGWYGYRASKSALNMLIKTAQIEIGRRFKHCALVLYHPGTIDTRLSVPFQANVPKGRLFTPAYTAKQLVMHLAELGVNDAPHYIDWSGQPIPW